MNKNELKLTHPSGGYWEHLRKLGLPNYIILTETNEIVVIKGKEERKMKGRGRRRQIYFHLQDGRVYHSSKFKKIENLVEFNRIIKIEKILENEGHKGNT